MRHRRRTYILIGIAIALAWMGARLPEPVQIVEAHTTRNSAVFPGSEPGSIPTPLPVRIERSMLPPATRDPFVMAPPPAPPASKQPQPVNIPPPPPPSPPAVNLSFIGRITAPDGKEVIYLAYGDASMPIAVGQTLANGYKVEAITGTAVELSYPSLNATTRIELPPPPKYEIR